MAERRYRLISILTRLLVAVALVVVSVMIFSGLFLTRPIPAASERAGAPPRVLVMDPEPVPVARIWTGYGTARAMDAAEVPARVGATVTAIPPHVDEGLPVDVGDLLVQLDPTDFERSLAVAAQEIANLEAQLRQIDVDEQILATRLELAEEDVRIAREQYERYASAFEEGAARQREVDEAQQSLIRARREEVLVRESLDSLAPRRDALNAQLEAARQRHQLAQLDVQRTSITAPISGIIETVDVELGESVAPGDRVARIVSLDHIEVPIRLPAAARPQLNVGDVAEIVAVSDDQRAWEARIARIAPVDDEETRTVPVYIELIQSGESRRVTPGRFLRAAVATSEQRPRWVMPRRSIRDGRVWIVVDGRVQSVPVNVDYHIERRFPAFGLPDEQWVVLHEPLPDEAYVVLDASRALSIGQEVSPVLPEEIRRSTIARDHEGAAEEVRP